MDSLEPTKSIEKAKTIEDLGTLDDQFDDLINAATHARSVRQRFALCVDATGSMQGVWNTAKDALKKAVDQIKTRSHVPVQICVVAYRDHIEDSDVIQQSEWSDDTDYLKQFISYIRCHGGGDYPESVGHGLRCILQQSVNQVILIGDAPGKHGSLGYEEARALGADKAPVYALYTNTESRLVENFTEIARLSGGRAFHLRSLSSMDEIFQVLLASNKALQIEFQPTTAEAKRLLEEISK